MEIIHAKELKIYGEPLYGSFASVYTCYYDKTIYKYKEFTDDFKMTRSFLKKLDELSKITDQDLLVPLVLVLDDNDIPTGYLAVDGLGITIDNLERKRTINPVETLKEAKKVLLRMHNEGIIHGDLHYGNIIFNNSGVKFIDFDNCSYKNHGIVRKYCFDYAEEFLTKYGTCEELDITMFNYLTFSILNKKSNGYFRVRNDIMTNNYGDFDSESSKRICQSLLLQDDKPSSEFLIDTLKI